jgi:hypothetical protein
MFSFRATDQTKAVAFANGLARTAHFSEDAGIIPEKGIRARPPRVCP